MRALLWKEFCDKRVWAIVWATLIVLLFGRTVNFCGYGDCFMPWHILPILLSVVVGATAYSTELKGNRIDFLYTQPIPWTKQLLAKVLFGFVVAFGSVALAALVFRIFCPDYYAAFATPARLAEVVGSIGWWLWTLYLCGLFYSVVLPGVEGGLIIFFVCLLPIIFLAEIVSTYAPADIRSLVNIGASQSIFIGPTIAGLLMLRFGLSLPQRSRVIRYGLVVLAVYVTVPAIVMMVPKDTFVSGFCKSRLCRRDVSWSSISPRGDYALVHYRWRLEERIGVFSSDIDLRQRDYAIRLSDGKTTPVDIDLPQCQICVWMNGNTAYCCSAGMPGIRVVRLTPSGKAAFSWVKLEDVPTQILPSRDGSAAIVASQGPKGTGVVVLDIVSGRPVIPPIQQASAYWWQSGNQVGYLDSHGARHILSLRQMKRDTMETCGERLVVMTTSLHPHFRDREERKCTR